MRSIGRHWQPLAALAASLAIACVIVAAQPVRAPWWYHADADATYTGSSLNLAGGDHIVFLGHPGIPLQEALASAFLVEHVARRALGDDHSIREFVDERLLDLDRTRVVFRGLGTLWYLLGAVALCIAAARVTGSWLWGAGGGVLWIGAPNLAPMSIQYRPDAVHAILVVCAGLLLARAAFERRLGPLIAAAAVIGLTVTIKAHALGLLVPLAAVVVFRAPSSLAVRPVLTTARAWLQRHRLLVVLVLVLWVVTGVALNRGQGYPVTTSDVITSLALLGGLAAGALALTSRVPYVVRVAGVVTTAFCAGLVLPATLAAHDTVAAITEIARTATGGGVNSYTGVETGSPRDLFGPLLRQTTVLYALAVVAAIVGWRRADIRPAVWLLGATSLGAMALARLGTPHYFAPSFLLSVLAVAWLCSRVNRVAGLILASALAVWIVGVQFRHRDGNTDVFLALREQAEPVYEQEVGQLGPGSALLTPSEHLYLPVPDTHYFEFVRPHVARTPKVDYRTLPATQPGAEFALERGLDVPAYVGPRVATLSAAAAARLDLGETPVVQRITPTELRRLAEGGR